jgi:hypothetical protein
MSNGWQDQTLQTKIMIIGVVLAALALVPAYAQLQNHAASGPSNDAARVISTSPGGDAPGTYGPVLTRPPQASPGLATQIATTTKPSPTLLPSLPWTADLGAGLPGWTGSTDNWTLAKTSFVTMSGSYEALPFLWPSFNPGARDYAVEARIRQISCIHDSCNFGLVVRSDGRDTGYAVGVGRWGNTGVTVMLPVTGTWGESGPSDENHWVRTGVDPGAGGWNTYRLEVHGDVLTFRIDGGLIYHYEDTELFANTAGQVGLWANRAQIEMSSFRVLPS